MSATASAPEAASKGQIPEDQVIVLFGATGDLAKRKLLPGMFHLARVGLMPRRFRIIGTVPAAFDSAAHGLVGLHVMHLPLDDR